MSPVSGQQSQNGSNGTSVPDGARSIFRTEARRQDQQVRARILLPRLVSPRAFALFWLLALLLTVAGAVVAFWPILSPFLA